MMSDYDQNMNDGKERIFRDRNRVLYLTVAIASASILVFMGILLWTLNLADSDLIVFLALVTTSIQLLLLSRLSRDLKELARRATTFNIRLGYRPQNLKEEDYAGCNLAYARVMTMSAAFGLAIPWIMAMVVFL